MELLLEQWPLKVRELGNGSAAGLGSVLATFRVRSGSRAGASLPIRRTVAAVGAVPGNDVVLDSPGVAPRHAQLQLSGGVWSIADLGSPGGLVVDGEPVRGEAWLAPGSTLQIGDVSVVFDPADDWQDSERAVPIAAPFRPIMFPQSERRYWPTALFVLAAFGIIVVLFFLFRKA